MTDYEAGEFDPPAPVARVLVRGPNNQTATNVPVLVDTGSDVSTLPADVVRAVGGTLTASEIQIEYLDGVRESYDETLLTVEYLHYRFRGRFLVTPADYGLFGRNILNGLVLTLDG